MTVPPLTERLREHRARYGEVSLSAWSSYAKHLLLETAEAVEFATEKIASLSQSAADLDTARQAAEARVAALTEALNLLVGASWDFAHGSVLEGRNLRPRAKLREAHDAARDALAGTDEGA